MTQPETTPAPRLAARELTLGYDDRVVVDRLDLDVLEGRVTAIVGANACGKSTLMLVDRPLRALSGGQRQRVWIAMALAQETDLLLLDEPTTYLDISHQVDLLRLLRTLNRETGRTIVTVLHDLNLACRYSDHLVVMADGRILAEGPPAEVVTAEVVEKAFGLPCVVVPDPVAGTPMVVPAGD